MRYFFVACLLFAALPQVLFAADDEYVLRHRALPGRKFRSRR